MACSGPNVVAETARRFRRSRREGEASREFESVPVRSRTFLSCLPSKSIQSASVAQSPSAHACLNRTGAPPQSQQQLTHSLPIHFIRLCESFFGFKASKKLGAHTRTTTRAKNRILFAHSYSSSSEVSCFLCRR